MDKGQLYSGKTVLVLGGGGSIGSTLCQQLSHLRAETVLAVDFSEYNLFKLRELGLNNVVTVLGDACDWVFLEHLLNQYRKIEYIFNAAAYKHVNFVQENIYSGIRNNLLVAFNSKRAASMLDCTFIQISSDKAVNPVNIMGLTKRLSEIIALGGVSCASASSRVVRFGNVLNSSGSVVPIFERQIKAGGPVTVTDRFAKRFFMSLDSSVDLVLASPLASFRERPIFALDMGDQCNIRVGKNMIQQAGYIPVDKMAGPGQIEIKIIGLRDGEKLEEQLSYGKCIPTNIPTMLEALESDEHYEIHDRLVHFLADFRLEVMTEITEHIVFLCHWILVYGCILHW